MSSEGQFPGFEGAICIGHFLIRGTLNRGNLCDGTSWKERFPPFMFPHVKVPDSRDAGFRGALLPNFIV
eukprot:211358-Amphidinium_carterae.1